MKDILYMQELYAENITKELFHRCINVFIRGIQVVNEKSVKRFENSVTMKLFDKIDINFTKSNGWFYVTLGMDTFRRRHLAQLLNIFTKKVKKLRDKFFVEKTNIIIEEIKDILEKVLGKRPSENDIVNRSRFNHYKIDIHKYMRFTKFEKSGIANILVNPDIPDIILASIIKVLKKHITFIKGKVSVQKMNPRCFYINRFLERLMMSEVIGMIDKNGSVRNFFKGK